MESDLISREALYETLCMHPKYGIQVIHGPNGPEGTIFGDCGNDFAGMIVKAPGVDAVEVVHGRWNTKWLLGHEYAECSRCGCSMVDTNKFWGSNFCPNCGAKMDGERKDNGNL